MFDNRLFETWPLVLVGACIFAGLFGIMAILVEVQVGGVAAMSRTVVGFIIASFTGYVAVACLIRSGTSSRMRDPRE